ncbi:hypothetical protein HYALB_00004102 [Hymenoscyphus albidus]|uniref:Ribonuclease H2 subunit B n=1 Tax=Hymenoscyphus albidus TaxID=595503 RepID=A0A9N9Q8A5_9HELO|nr:hypothetical protein HYALB_00004102 [Hymenoscyphus albidus]
MAKTRGRPAKKAEKETEEKTVVSTDQKVQLNPDVANPPQLFILPENLSEEARIIQIENSRHSTNSPYVVCPKRGFFELTKVSAPKSTPRSWLLSGDHSEDSKANGADIKQTESKGETVDQFSTKGYVLRNANLMVATPIDALFLILPALTPKSAAKASGKKLFLSGEDYLDKMASASPELAPLLRNESLRSLIEKRMAVVCDTVEAGDETMYRVNEGKILTALLQKAKKMTKQGLPPSMEEKFVRKALEVPTLIIACEEEEDAVKPANSAISTPPTETPDTQSTITSFESTTSSVSQASTAATSLSGDSSVTVTANKKSLLPPITAPDGVADLLRLRTAMSFLCSKYMAPYMSESIKKLASSPETGTDFAPLDAHIADLAKLRQEAIAARSLGDASRKRGFEDDEGDGEGRAEKKRKKEEDEKRKKAGESRGVKTLKKVNVSGMKKMSDFFKKK